MKTFFKLSAFFILLSGAAGCITVGREFSTSTIPGIIIGTTTMNEIRGTYGEPYRKGIDDGDLTWTYVRYRISVFSGNYTRDLYIKFDKAGVVRSYSYNTSFPDEEVSVKP
ncbi:MAG: hypothetical protein A2297_06695 [Elusimicrobia bacterium RIFOXYB2_FULL_48_7]|nr:MAG: hypothetical protein A2297_06695 [Elusimicrobia bacterium RIFOXYB2_FULL_48_7]